MVILVGDDYSTGGAPAPTPAPPAPPNPYWSPGTLINPGQYVEPTKPNGFRYKATQASAAYTAGAEPAWPTVAGATVADGGVTWTAEAKATVTWTASRIMQSGLFEPAWPLAAGVTVVDGGVVWTAQPRYVQDPKCPHTYPVLIAASKIYAPGIKGDIVRYCATVQPLDWSTPRDAGYLPTGLQSYGSNPVKALGLYRAKVVPANAEGLQVWAVDEDPDNMALADALPVGCVHPDGMVPVANDLLFVSAKGVRSLGVVGVSNSMQSGDVGMPVDPMVQALLAAGLAPMACYVPSMGQAWFMFPDVSVNETQVMVYTLTRPGEVGAWSRYLLPYAVQDWAIDGVDLLLRSADHVYRMDETLMGDQLTDGAMFTPAPGVIQTPWLEFGNPGGEKAVECFDIVASGDPSVAIGYNENDPTAWTEPYEVPADTVPDTPIPMPVTGASLSVRITFSGTQRWTFNALKLTLTTG